MTAAREIKFGIAWVRGVVGEALTPELVIAFSRAFGTWADAGPVVLGRDTRRSSPMLHAAAVSGLLASGCDIIDLDACSTPMVSFAVRELGAAGGLSITGSHNEASWNALKFIGPDGALLNAVRSEELLDIYHASAFRDAPLRAHRRFTAPIGLRDRYTEHLLCQIDAAPVCRRGFRVAIDFRHGPASGLAPELLRRLGATLTPLHGEPARAPGVQPEPAVRNMGRLAEAVRETGADLGAALNMDGDRIAFVTERGEPLSGEFTLPLLAQQRLRRRPGAIVTNASTSSRVVAVARAHGQAVLRAPVGESHVMDRALEEGAVLAGEGSGGAAALPGTMTFDALLSLGLILERLAADGTRISEAADALPVTHMHKGEVRCPPPAAYRAMDVFRSHFHARRPDTTDGVRVEWEDGAWVHVRVSNTEPILRIICEADDRERADRIFRACMERARAAVGGE